ncbi:hypothetical protein OAP32_00715 [Crocinitomicaceae bacterium]|nr:hypothetical protein [Crocinitomicaceae bacterium]
MSTFTIPNIDIDVEVRDQDRNTVEVDGTDLRIHGENGTLEVTIMGNVVDDTEQAILNFLHEKGLGGSVSDVADALSSKDIINDVMAQPDSIKLAIVKAIMKEM